MSALFKSFEERYLLGVSAMDETHREFAELLMRLDTAGKEAFVALFDELIRHTEKHFKHENLLMQESGFPAIREHMDEHLRVLGELKRIGSRVAAGSTAMGRVYIREQLPSWFSLHAITMDSALAAHIRKRPVTCDR